MKTNTNRFPESRFSLKSIESAYVLTIPLKRDFLFPGGAPKCYEFPARSSPRTANRDVENRVPKTLGIHSEIGRLTTYFHEISLNSAMF